MTGIGETNKIESARPVVFLSKPLDGIMADRYFDIASPEHFWCKRRFEVLRKLADGKLRSAQKIAEIGCGNGLLIRQIEDAYDVAPVGFDLHEKALSGGICRRGQLYCYDIHDRAGEFRNAFDLLLMFDVLEHIDDQDRFLDSAKFHLAKGGCIIINVPALQWLYSPYDEVQGHRRRYSLDALLAVAQRCGFHAEAITYWGAPLVPVLAMRKAVLAMRKTSDDTYATGFDPGGKMIDSGLLHLSRCELLPQRLAGVSVMAVIAAD
jgi:SAM-dependent methyltransferase